MSDNDRDGAVPRDTSTTWGGTVSQPPPETRSADGGQKASGSSESPGSSDSSGTPGSHGSSASAERSEATESRNGEVQEEHLGVGRPYLDSAAPPAPPHPQPWRQAGRPTPVRPGSAPQSGTSTASEQQPAQAARPQSSTQPVQQWEQSPAAQPGAQQAASQTSRQSARSTQQQASTTWTPAAGQSAPSAPSGQGAAVQPGQQARTVRTGQTSATPQQAAASSSAYARQQGAQAASSAHAAQAAQAAQTPATQTPAAYWAQRPETPASPVARRRGGESPLARSAAAQAAQAARTPGLDDDEPLAEETRRPVPRYGVKGVLYRTLRINLGPSKRDLDELDIRERLNRQTRRTRGYCGYIGIASEKGGVGKTTLASLLAAEIAEGRRESVGIADLNPDLGTLPDRFGVRPHYSIRDLLAHVDEIPWRYHVHDFMEKVPEMNVRVLAASTDRKIRHQLSVADVELLAELFAPFFSFAIFDNGTHITHEAMLGTLRTAHGMVLVTDNTRDGANLARKTLQFLSDNGFPEMRRRVVLSVVAKETASPIKVRAIEKAFRDHVRDLIVVPYDPALDGGGKIPFRDPNAVNKILRKETRMAVRRLAAVIMDDLVA